MEHIDPVKWHQASGKYEELVRMGQDLHRRGMADSEEDGVFMAADQHRDIAKLVLYGPKYPQWTHIATIRKAVGAPDPDAFRTDCFNLAMRSPVFAEKVRRGDFMPTGAELVAKADRERNRPDPLPPGKTAKEALIDVAKRYQAQGVPHGEAHDRAASEHPLWYTQYERESRQR